MPISRFLTAVFVDGAAHFRNFGTTSGGITSNGTNGTLLNRGGISGRVSFGVGNDLVDNTSGRIESQTYPGGGNDRCIGDHDAGKMTSDSGADRFDFNGFDEVLPMVGTTNHLITDFATIDARGL